MVHNSYKNFDMIELDNGIILVSKCGCNYPFVFLNHQWYGFTIIIGDEIKRLYNIEDCIDFNFKEMATYKSDNIKDGWVVTIPYRGKKIEPKDCFIKEEFELVNQFSPYKVPFWGSHYNLAIVTGIECEQDYCFETEKGIYKLFSNL